MSFASAEAERLLANMIRVGVVSALDEVNARVTVRVGGLTTDWLPWLTGRAGATRTWSAPRAGEQVLVLSPYGDLSQAVVLPAIYQDSYAAPAGSKDVERVVFPDGALAEYDSAAKVLTVTTAGNVVINCASATVNASTSVRLDTPQTTCTGNLTVQGLLTYQGGLTGSGGTGASMNGNLSVTGTIINNGKNVGSTHTHSGVVSGGSNTGAPV